MKTSEIVTESIKGQGTQALRKVLADFGLQPGGSIYSDKRRSGRRVKATLTKPNPKAFKGTEWIKVPPSQQEVEASVARHFGGMNVLKVVVHKYDKNRFNDHSYIAVAYSDV